MSDIPKAQSLLHTANFEYLVFSERYKNDFFEDGSIFSRSNGRIGVIMCSPASNGGGVRCMPKVNSGGLAS